MICPGRRRVPRQHRFPEGACARRSRGSAPLFGRRARRSKPARRPGRGCLPLPVPGRALGLAPRRIPPACRSRRSSWRARAARCSAAGRGTPARRTCPPGSSPRARTLRADPGSRSAPGSGCWSAAALRRVVAPGWKAGGTVFGRSAGALHRHREIPHRPPSHALQAPAHRGDPDAALTSTSVRGRASGARSRSGSEQAPQHPPGARGVVQLHRPRQRRQPPQTPHRLGDDAPARRLFRCGAPPVRSRQRGARAVLRSGSRRGVRDRHAPRRPRWP